mmetsp:Transcript_17557/g.44201  ORF Transcript_17557/g.44201 Transcript_17557/m.44201 type:complete len:224 (-) Transcript_17557:22-693(-)
MVYRPLCCHGKVSGHECAENHPAGKDSQAGRAVWKVPGCEQGDARVTRCTGRALLHAGHHSGHILHARLLQRVPPAKGRALRYGSSGIHQHPGVLLVGNCHCEHSGLRRCGSRHGVGQAGGVLHHAGQHHHHGAAHQCDRRGVHAAVGGVQEQGGRDGAQRARVAALPGAQRHDGGPQRGAGGLRAEAAQLDTPRGRRAGRLPARVGRADGACRREVRGGGRG